MADHINPSDSEPRYEPLPPLALDSLSPPGTPIPMDELSPDSARPRFLGMAALDDGPRPRDSYLSDSSNLHGAGGSLASSVYALNPTGSAGNRSSALLTGGYRDDPNADDLDGSFSPGGLSPASPSTPKPEYLAEKRATYASPAAKRRRWIWIAAAAATCLVLAVILGVVFGVLKKGSSNDDASDSSSGDSGDSGSGSGSGGSSSRLITGGDGSTVTMDDGTTFTYENSFGGTWYYDPEDPFNNAARAQSWSPALNETFNYGSDIIRGVNLGGWLVTEPFIVPGLYEPYVNASTSAVDEWTLSENMRNDSSNGGIQQLVDHYDSFITEKDFAQIAGAGLNWVRIPLPWWAIEVRGDEPFLANTCWSYFLKAIQWARKYGLRINLDLHAVPGSQNGWNHSGKLGSINLLFGPMGFANAQRTLDYIRILAEFISQDEYKDVVAMFGVTNEPEAPSMGQDVLSRYYLQSYDLIRTAGGVGAGNGPMISYHDGFSGLSKWAGFLPGADRISLDIHQYIAFGTQSDAALSSFQDTPCSAWASAQNTSMSDFGLTTAGEWEIAVNDCGLYVNGVGLGARYDGTYADGGDWPDLGSCVPFMDYTTWSDDDKAAYKAFALSSMDALQNWFFWTWKIGNSTVYGKPMAPHWSYQLGLENGWMPTDPREAVGACSASAVWTGPLPASATGGVSTDNIAASVSSSYSWPPPTISSGGAVTELPSYTPTAALPTLPGVTVTATTSSGKSTATTTIVGGGGWENAQDTASMMTDRAGCTYLDPWCGPSATLPATLCPSADAKRSEPTLTGLPRWRRDV